MALNPKQQKFCLHYAAYGNPTAAAIHAGYSANTAEERGRQLLQQVVIEEYLANAKKTPAERLGITQEWLLEKFRANFERCTELVPVLNRKGEQVFIDGPDGQQVPAYTLYDPKAAAKFGEMLGKHLKMFTDKVEVANPEGETFKFEPLTAEEAAQQWQEICKGT